MVILTATPSHAAIIITPGDGTTIFGGRADTELNPTTFTKGNGNGTGGANSWPGGEGPANVLDGSTATKYLNFAQTLTGFVITPTFNGGLGSIVSSLQITTGNDSPERDPASYQIWGSNSFQDFNAASLSFSSFTQIATGTLSLPTDRNTVSAPVSFSNPNSFTSYLIFFPTVRIPASANSMQLDDIQLFGVTPQSSLKWTGANGSIWDTSTQNWVGGGNPLAFTNDGSTAVTFDDTGSNTNITVQNGGTAVVPVSVAFNNSTAVAYTIGGDSINSSGGLTKTGNGTVTLNSVNSFAGGVLITGGTLNIGATGSVGSGSFTLSNNNSTADGTTVTVNLNSAQTIGNLSGTVAFPTSGTNSAILHLEAVRHFSGRVS